MMIVTAVIAGVGCDEGRVVRRMMMMLMMIVVVGRGEVGCDGEVAGGDATHASHWRCCWGEI